jgi:hypothetical protein
MKRIINFFIVIVIATICLTACEKSYHYIVEGRLIDKITREPVEGIMVSFNKYDIIHPRDGQKAQKMTPIGKEGWSNENGEFCTLETYSTSFLYIYGFSSNENGLYKDTTILVDFSNVPLSGKPSKNYKGSYVLNIGDIELGKIE